VHTNLTQAYYHHTQAPIMLYVYTSRMSEKIRKKTSETINTQVNHV